MAEFRFKLAVRRTRKLLWNTDAFGSTISTTMTLNSPLSPRLFTLFVPELPFLGRPILACHIKAQWSVSGSTRRSTTEWRDDEEEAEDVSNKLKTLE